MDVISTNITLVNAEDFKKSLDNVKEKIAELEQAFQQLNEVEIRISVEYQD